MYLHPNILNYQELSYTMLLRQQILILERLIEAFIPNDSPPDQQQQIQTDTLNFVVAQINHMSTYLIHPYRMVLVMFNLLAVLRYGKPFRRLSRQQRIGYVNLWSNSPISLMRDFIKLIRSLTLFAYYDHELTYESLTREAQIFNG